MVRNNNHSGNYRCGYDCIPSFKKEGVVADDILDLAIYCVIFGVIGARLYYVTMKRENFNSFYDVIAIWNGGLAIYGGIIAGFITGFVITKIKR